MKTFKGHAGLMAMAVAAVSFESHADPISLQPGRKMTIGAGSPVYEFNLTGAQLNVTPGGETGRIVADANSQVHMDGGAVTSTGTSAITLRNSSAVIDNSRIIARADPSRPGVSAFGVRLSGLTRHPAPISATASFPASIVASTLRTARHWCWPTRGSKAWPAHLAAVL